MGGADPYSASKGCAELVTEAYRRSLLRCSGRDPISRARAPATCSAAGTGARTGSFPTSCARSRRGSPLVVRNPASVRPWQHVLEPLYGYLLLAGALLRGGASFAGGWNFGPDADASVDVATVHRDPRRSLRPRPPGGALAAGDGWPARGGAAQPRQQQGACSPWLAAAPRAPPGRGHDRRMVSRGSRWPARPPRAHRASDRTSS